MTKAADLAHQVVQARNELNNLRKTIRGLQAEHRKDVLELKKVIAGMHTPTPTLQLPKTPQQQAVTSDDHLLQGWRPIGHIQSWFRTKNGTPRQGSVSSLTRGVLRLAPHTFTNPHHALQGLEDFSHVWILFVFDKNEERGGKGHCRSKVAPPRLGGQRVGVFGTRSPHRPNPLGLTLARLDRLEGDCLHLSGLDILDGTPVLDIKPYILQYDAPPVVASHFTDPTRVASRTRLDKGVDSLIHEDRIQGEKFMDKASEGEIRPKYNEDVNRLQRETYNHELSKDENKPTCDENMGVLMNDKLQRGKYSQETSKEQNKPKCDENVGFLMHEKRLHEGKSRHKSSQDENKPHSDILKSQNQMEKVHTDEKCNIRVTNCQSSAMTQILDKTGMKMGLSEYARHTNLSSELSEEDVRERKMLDVHGDIKEAGKGRGEEKIREGEVKMRKSEMVHVLDDIKESEKCKDEKCVEERSEEKGKRAALIAESQYEEGDEERSKAEGKGAVSMASWISEPPTVPLQVLFNPIAEEQVQAFSRQARDEKFRLEYLADGKELREAITSVLRQDPRSVYRREKCPSLLYYLSVDTAHVTAWFEGSCAEVLRVQPLSAQCHIVQQSGFS